MNSAVDSTIDRWQLLQRKNADSGRVPTLRDAALTVAIRRLSDVVLARDIWL
jgi:hypothetical protein